MFDFVLDLTLEFMEEMEGTIYEERQEREFPPGKGRNCGCRGDFNGDFKPDDHPQNLIPHQGFQGGVLNPLLDTRSPEPT